MEAPSFDSSPAEDDALLRLETVDPAGKHRLDGRRDGDPSLEVVRLKRDDVLDEERVPLRGRDDALPYVVVDRPELLDQTLGLGVRQRREREERGIRARRGPRR